MGPSIYRTIVCLPLVTSQSSLTSNNSIPSFFMSCRPIKSNITYSKSDQSSLIDSPSPNKSFSTKLLIRRRRVFLAASIESHSSFKASLYLLRNFRILIMEPFFFLKSYSSLIFILYFSVSSMSWVDVNCQHSLHHSHSLLFTKPNLHLPS